MGLSPAQQNAANSALLELRTFQARAYSEQMIHSFAPDQDSASAGALLKNLDADRDRIDVLEQRLGEVATGDREFSNWVDQAQTIHDDIAYQSGIANTFAAWDVLSSALGQTATDVKDLGANVVAPAAIGTLGVIALVALAYLVFELHR